MKIKEYLKNYNKNYEVHTNEIIPYTLLWNNWNNHIDSWLNKYGNHEIIGIHEEVNEYGMIITKITINTRNEYK